MKFENFMSVSCDNKDSSETLLTKPPMIWNGIIIHDLINLLFKVFPYYDKINAVV
jgi:hypothetical protein